jgi:predicted anti-sigma-YlaC factor YlaD
MNCQLINENIIDYLEGNLANREQAKFENHLSGCANCQALVNTIGITYSLARKPDELKVSNDFVDETINRLYRKEARVVAMFYTVLKPMAVAASIGLGIIIGNGEVSLLQNTNYSEQEAIVMSLTNGSDYSVWQSFEEDYGNEN